MSHWVGMHFGGRGTKCLPRRLVRLLVSEITVHFLNRRACAFTGYLDDATNICIHLKNTGYKVLKNLVAFWKRVARRHGFKYSRLPNTAAHCTETSNETGLRGWCVDLPL